MLLDLRTVLWLTAFANAALTLWQLATVDREHRRHDHGIWFLASTTLLALGFAGFAQQGVWPDWVSVWLANLALVAASQSFHIGARSIAQRGRANRRDAYAAAFYSGVFSMAYLAEVRILPRVLMVSAALMTWFCAAIRHLHASPATKELRSVRAMVVWLSLAVALLALRAGYLLLSAEPPPQVLDGSVMAFATMVIAFLGTLVCGVGILSVGRERSESDLLRLATVDPLTELPNRRALLEYGERKVALHLRNGRPLTMLMIDLDHFKAINDSHGHQVGDEVLRQFAAVSRASLRTSDLLARAGGEEFYALLPETDAETALAAAERLRTAIAARDMGHGHPGLHITCSIGVAAWHPEDGGLDPLIHRADQAMYAAKAKGRDCVVLYDDIAPAA